MYHLNLGHQVRTEQYRDLYREARQEQLWARSGLAAEQAAQRHQFTARIWQRIRLAATEIACRLPLTRETAFCSVPTRA